MLNLSRNKLLLLGILIGVLLMGSVVAVAVTILNFNAPWVFERDPTVSQRQLVLERWQEQGNNLSVSLRDGDYPDVHPEDVVFDGSYLWVSDYGELTEAGDCGNAPNGYLLIVDPRSLQVLQRIEVGKRPYGLAFDGQAVWVLNSCDNNVMRIEFLDEQNRHVAIGGQVRTTTFPDNADGEAGTFDAPRWAAFDGKYVWVTNRGGSTITPLFAADGPDHGYEPIEVGAEPRGITFDGHNLWVAVSGANQVVKIPLIDPTIVDPSTEGRIPESEIEQQAIEIEGSPRDLLFDGVDVWVTSYDVGKVFRIRASDGAVVQTYPVGKNPWGLGFDGRRIYVAINGSDDVTVLDATGDGTAYTIPAGGAPTSFAFDGTFIWWTNWEEGVLIRR